ncbi:TPA: hypothetical protein U0613_000794 [Streptococcus suis]|nr:hypothetical protein [Streptococcus suis]
MKRPIHLYIFVVLSSIASVLRGFNIFFAKYDEAVVRQLLQNFNVEGIDEAYFTYMRESINFQTNLVNKAFAVVLLLAVIATIVLLFLKKNEQASYTYLGYLFVTLLFSTYAFIGEKGLGQIYTDSVMRQSVEAQAMRNYIIRVVLFAIYFGVTIFFHLRKPKEKPSTAINSTDI